MKALKFYKRSAFYENNPLFDVDFRHYRNHYCFFSTIATSPLIAVIILISGTIGLVPIYALITALDDIEQLKIEVSRLSSNLRAHERQENNEPYSVLPPPPSIPQNKEIAKRNWQCIKCVTVNKAGTYKCSNCGTLYDPYINPTD